ncbi:peptidoglycan-binding domain-containing protein [Frigidibacter mobilis]|uniref:Putative lipoprotein n=1 Tax=Frigidibacter mobilis TaxID=1335048 RepID=A0A159Z670_9RHOB|nr:peptidoglycan-binding domain-containing protein [Frigidibacter mobilis]AMY69970.1 putative lipoprotein [Frigidibacter mobilis]
MMPAPPRPSVTPLPPLPLLRAGLVAIWALAGCGPSPVPAPDIAQSYAPEIVTRPLGSQAPGGPRDACWGRQITPALIETVTEQVVDRPAALAADGKVLRPASYRSVTRQAIVRERAELWFRTPCPAEMSPDLIATAQRALAARGLFHGQVTGEMDAPTGRAVRRFQAERGLDSPVLSLAAARDLGLIAVGRHGG